MSNHVRLATSCFNMPVCKGRSDDFASCEKQIIKYFDNKLEQLFDEEPDFILFPEACNRFAYHSYTSGPNGSLRVEHEKGFNKYLGDRLVEYFSGKAKEANTNIAFAQARFIPTDEKYPYRNCLTYINRDGSIAGIYNKNHLTPPEFDFGIACGEDAKVIELDFGKVASAICFDLNFNELMEKYIPQKPDLICFASAYHGAIRQSEWAYECKSYFMSCCQDPLGSRILNPFGQTVATTTTNCKTAVKSVNLDYVICHYDKNAAKLRDIKKKYKSAVEIYDPDNIGMFMLSSESKDFSAKDIVREFELETYDEYFEKTRKLRTNQLAQRGLIK